MKHLFLINPKAGKGNAQSVLLEQIGTAFDPAEVEVIHTQYPGHATQLARAAGESGETVRVYACGGDGTLNEVVNGAAGFENLAVTLVPMGTGNDFLRIFRPLSGGKSDPAAFRDLNALKEGPQSSFDVMECNDKLGLGVVCAGVDARIGAEVHKYDRIRAVSNTGAYVVALIVNFFLKDIARPLRVELEDTVWDRDTTVLCVCNARYYGGGFMPIRDNRPDDGMLEVLLVPRISRLTFARLVKTYATGGYAKVPHLIKFHRTRALTFSSAQPTVAVVDGEVMEDTHFTLRLSEKKVNFFYPQSLTYLPEGETAVEAGVI